MSYLTDILVVRVKIDVVMEAPATKDAATDTEVGVEDIGVEEEEAGDEAEVTVEREGEEEEGVGAVDHQQAWEGGTSVYIMPNGPKRTRKGTEL